MADNSHDVPLDLDPEIDRLAKVHAESGSSLDRYLLGLPVRFHTQRLDESPAPWGPVPTVVSWTGVDGARYTEKVTVHHFEVTEFVHHRARLLYS